MVISLVYVGRQVRDTNSATRAQAYQALVAQLAVLQTTAAQNERISTAYHHVLFENAGLDDFGEADAMSLSLLFAAQARVYEAVYRQAREGVLDESALQMLSGLRILRTRAWTDAWRTLADTLDEESVAYLDRERARLEATPAPAPAPAPAQPREGRRTLVARWSAGTVSTTMTSPSALSVRSARIS
ncbi:MAG TPA: hypothetical protein VFQ22_08375 [Longimicrobiales bacterium]|nr:hypothetical protein [Longimicrobiales bacterium]